MRDANFPFMYKTLKQDHFSLTNTKFYAGVIKGKRKSGKGFGQGS
jgi:hypothetical protein